MTDLLSAPSVFPPTSPEVTRAMELLADELLVHRSCSEIANIIERTLGSAWPSTYKNRETGRVYTPHHKDEKHVVYSDTPRYVLVKGGEGGGKSVLGIIKTLERVRRGCSGLFVSPDLPHFKRSLWPEFQRWCPWEQVIDKHQIRGDPAWEPYQPFILVFRNGARLYCGGMDEPGAWEGPNVNFAHLDEARRKKDASALKVIDGRVRIPGPNGEPPQVWFTTTPRKHWLYDYFGPLKIVCKDCGEQSAIEVNNIVPPREVCPSCSSPHILVEDERELFKRSSCVISLLTRDNEVNLEKNFAAKRAQTLTAAEARVLLAAEWEDIDEGQPFIPHSSWWDLCRETLPPLTKDEPLILSVDAATGRVIDDSDCFAIVGVTRHPDPLRRANTVAVRYVNLWQVKAGEKIDFVGTPTNPGPERELLRLCGWAIDDTTGRRYRTHDRPYNVKCIVADPHELNDLIQRFSRLRVAWMKEFGQVDQRFEADTDLLRLISERRLAHDGDKRLRQHILNADRKLNDDGHKMRMVKREDSLKIDAAVALSQGAYWCLYLQGI